jgi:hypothetical protein
VPRVVHNQWEVGRLLPCAGYSLIWLGYIIVLKEYGFVYVEISGGMYGLIQAGAIANRKLVSKLAAHDDHQMARTPGLFKHATRPIWFSLTVDDFLIAFVGKENADHLLHLLESNYQITKEWDAKTYCGLNLDWDYINRTIDISMPGYVAKALQRFEHPSTSRKQDSPHAWTKPDNGAKQQLTPPIDDSRNLEASEKLSIQEIVGTLLYYGRAVDMTQLVALGHLLPHSPLAPRKLWTQ